MGVKSRKTNQKHQSEGERRERRINGPWLWMKVKWVTARMNMLSCISINRRLRSSSPL
jgi:hypothetical protein